MVLLMKKPKPRLKKPKRRVRRNPYARALELAQHRMTKIEAERDRLYSKLMAVSQEIPKLQDVIRVLEGYFDRNGQPQPSSFLQESVPIDAPERNQSSAYIPSPLPASMAGIVPEHLRRFIPVHPTMFRPNQAQGGAVRSQVSGDDDDKFLVDNIGGETILE